MAYSIFLTKKDTSANTFALTQALTHSYVTLPHQQRDHQGHQKCLHLSRQLIAKQSSTFSSGVFIWHYGTTDGSRATYLASYLKFLVLRCNYTQVQIFVHTREP